jgi:hypothetical protein
MQQPLPRKRELKLAGGGVAIGGAPVSYVAILAAVVAVLALVPASVVVGGMGGGWPLHDVLHPLVGLLLGPVAGPLASAVGMLVGMAIAPYTSLGPWSPIMGAVSAFAVAMVAQGGSRWIVPWAIVLACHVIYWFLASGFGIGFGLWLSNVFTVTVALALIAVPAVRRWIVATVRDPGVSWRTGAALFVLFFFGSTAGIQALWVPNFITNPWPADVWPALVVIILVERVVFSLVGALVALGVVPVLRRSTFVKPALAGY